MFFAQTRFITALHLIKAKQYEFITERIFRTLIIFILGTSRTLTSTSVRLTKTSETTTLTIHLRPSSTLLASVLVIKILLLLTKVITNVPSKLSSPIVPSPERILPHAPKSFMSQTRSFAVARSLNIGSKFPRSFILVPRFEANTRTRHITFLGTAPLRVNRFLLRTTNEQLKVPLGL